MNHLKKHINISFLKKKVSGVTSWSRSFVSFTEKSEQTSENQNLENDHSLPPPIKLHRNLELCPKFPLPRQVWIENLDEVKEKKRGLVELHPKIFGTLPRLDLIYENVRWQSLYRTVTVYSARNRAEMPGGGRKPWPQKKTGRARQGSIRAPQFIKGGTCHGPRNPTSYFYMIPFEKRIHGLTSTLSAKFAQDDLHVVENLNIPTNDSQFISDLIKERNWGPSALFVDVNDIMPRNITIATDSIPHINLMPVYGLNVITMLKHDTLILTLAAVEEIEKRLVKLLNTPYGKAISKDSSFYKG